MRRIKWVILAVLWIVLRILLLPMDILFYLGELTTVSCDILYMGYCSIYNRFLSLFALVSIELRMIEERLDDDKVFIALADRDRKTLLRIMKKGE